MQNNNPPTPQNISRPGSRNHLNTINLSNLVTSSHSVTPITSSIATTHYQNNNQPINLISTGLNGNLTNLRGILGQHLFGDTRRSARTSGGIPGHNAKNPPKITFSRLISQQLKHH